MDICSSVNPSQPEYASAFSVPRTFWVEYKLILKVHCSYSKTKGKNTDIKTAALLQPFTMHVSAMRLECSCLHTVLVILSLDLFILLLAGSYI